MNTPVTKNVTLDTPIKRGEQTISDIILRKPNSGELRGLSLANLLQLEFDSLKKLLPRITTPTLTEHEIDSLDPADLVDIGTTTIGFLVKKDKLEPSPGI